jgi:Trypsin-like peptidase domain
MGGSNPWWADATVDWTRPEPTKVIEIFKSAYPTQGEILTVAARTGLPPRERSGTNADFDMWKWAIDTAVTTGLLIMLCDAIITDPNKEPFHELLYRLLYSDGTSGLQTVNEPALGLIDAQMDEQVSRDARRRTAMIEIGGQPAGTSFLVGPDLLLTAAHVIDASNFPPRPNGPVMAVFDFLPQGGRSRAETGLRVPIIDVGLVGSFPTQNEILNKASDFSATNEYLDFLLMRLDRNMASDDTNGPSRGFYELHKDDYAFGQAKLLRIIQHPLGQTLQISHAIGQVAVNQQKTRVRYKTNTLPGSSGAAVIDPNGRLVALHHFSARGFNQGVLISRIAARIEAITALPRLPAMTNAVAPAVSVVVPQPAVRLGPDPFETLGFGKEPFAGRLALRNAIKIMLDGNDRRILLVEGGPDTGKTYSHRYLTYLRAKQDHPALRQRVRGGLRIANVDLDKYVTVPREELHERIVTYICTALHVHSAATLAQPVRRVTDLVAHLEGMSIDDGVVSWIFIDSLDRHNLEQGQVKELIASLLQLVGGNEAIPVRLVLSSRPPTPVAQELVRWADRDNPEGLNREEVKDWLTKSALDKGRPLDEVRLAAKLNELFPPGTFPSARTLAIALPKSLDELLQEPA